MNFYKNKNAYLLMFFLRQMRHSLIIYLVIWNLTSLKYTMFRYYISAMCNTYNNSDHLKKSPVI